MRRVCEQLWFTALGACALMAGLSGQAAAAPRALSFDDTLVGPVRVVAPEGEPAAFVFLISDSDGITPQRLADADALVARGAAVALIDLGQFIARQAASDDVECHYALGDFEGAAHMAQRQLNMKTWRWPVILGFGAGGTAAYLSIAQAPDNTAAGAVSVGFEPRFKSKLPFCPGAPKRSREPDGSYSYAPMTEVPGRWTLITNAAPGPDVAPFVSASAGSKAEVMPGDNAEQLKAAVDAVLDIAATRAGVLADLPLVELPAKGRPAALFVLISGDGGWRDIDKQIGDFLADQGVSVVGVDALRYFWSQKDPKQIGADLDRIVAHYTKAWDIRTASVGGFSLGADVLPLAWSHISPAGQAKIAAIVLLGLEPTANLEVSLSGWLGMASSADIDLRPFLSGLPKDKVLCFYGVDEKRDNETACPFAELDGATRIERPGGHHFDGDYESVARLILDRLTRQAAK